MVLEYKTLCRELIRKVNRGYGDRKEENPKNVFLCNAKNGDFQNLQDYEYEDMFSDAKELGRIWLGQKSRTNAELLVTLLENLDLSEYAVEKISDILQEAHRNTDYTYVPDIAGGTDVSSWSAKQIYDYLDTNVYGQKEAKKAAAKLLWNHMQGRRQNLVFAGPTGCGKTEIFRQLQKLYPNIVIQDATSLTGEGWVGNMKIRNLFDCPDGVNPEHLIIVLDEADKLFEDVGFSHDRSRIIQNELLKILEGDTVHFKGNPSQANGEPDLELRTSNVSFVFVGSFETMVKRKEDTGSKRIGFLADVKEQAHESAYESTFSPQDLVRYAHVRQEIAGRIDEIVQLHPMTENDFYNILEDKNVSPIQKLSEYYHVNIKMSDAVRRRFARAAAANGMGVRFMRSQIKRKLEEQLFENASMDTCEIA